MEKTTLRETVLGICDKVYNACVEKDDWKGAEIVAVIALLVEEVKTDEDARKKVVGVLHNRLICEIV